jgi:formylglycine-generating enzyme required for sulfatase activity
MKKVLLLIPFCLDLSCSTAKPFSVPETPPGMVLIPGGTFMMGCTISEMGVWHGRDLDTCCASPRHEINLSAFLLDATEVTVEQYQECVDKGACKNPKGIQSCNWVHPDRTNHPMNCIDWLYANHYCTWRGKRLPSESEWEYAARGGHNEWRFPWGNDRPDCSRAIMRDDSGKGCGQNSTWPVRSRPPNGYGLYDMAGNVMEWTADCRNSDYAGAPCDGSAWKIGDCGAMILRGGCWEDEAPYLSASCRRSDEPSSGKYADYKQFFFNRPIAQVGFRCAKTANPKLTGQK